MAQGDADVFDSFLLQQFSPSVTGNLHHFGTTPNEFRIALINSDTALTTDLADPHWGGTGTTDLSANEVSTAGSYSGPVALANVSITLTSGEVRIDFDDPTAWAADASNDPDTKWAVIYNNTNPHKKCVGFIDLGPAFDHRTGPLSISFNSPAAFVINQG